MNIERLNEDRFIINDHLLGLSIIKDIENILASYFNKNTDVDQYAIRKLFQVIPALQVLFELPIIKELRKKGYFLTKSIYFNKPALSNWFVSYHQDLSISVKEKRDTKGYTGWTYKKGQHGVIPTLNVLENTITLRIHLDITKDDNGALRIIKNSHKNGILSREQIEQIDFNKEIVCSLKKGGLMFMKPLLLHASNKSTSSLDRRVIHLEFCNQELDGDLEWLERQI